MRKKIELGVLGILVVVLGYYAYQRIGIRMGGTPVPVGSRFASEEHWMMDLILGDLVRAAAHIRGVSADEARFEYELMPAGALELPDVRVDVSVGASLSSSTTLDLQSSFWASDNYVALATELLGAGVGSSPEPARGDVLETALEPTLPVLLAESARIESALSANLRDPLAHEEAAVLHGVFGLREAAYGFDDRRLGLLRMTTHLTLARALRHPQPLSVTGEVGEAVLLALAGRQRELLERLEGLPEPWSTALVLFSTEDWRRQAPTEPLLVQILRFRALVGTLGASTAIERTGDAVYGESAEWGRILSWYGSGDVASGGFVEQQIGRELAEAQSVALEHFGSALPPRELSDALNAQPGGVMGEDGPVVLDWPIWAAFYQRHLCGAILARNRMLRGTYGMPDEATTFAREVDLVASGLAMNPIVQVSLSRYVGGRVEDTVGMDDAIELTSRFPELVNPTNWYSLEDTAGHMMRKTGMPRSEAWLSPRVLATSALDSTRHRLPIFERTIPRADALAALTEIAPHHTFVVNELVEQLGRTEDEAAFETLSQRLGERSEYDLYALRDLQETARTTEEELEVRGRMCELDANECGALGWELAFHERTDEAVAAFERLRTDGSSSVTFCNNVNWLMNYYYDAGRKEEAFATVEQGSRVGCSWGFRSHAYLLEREGQVAQAEGYYRRDAERYEYEAPVAPPLMGFLHRMAEVRGDAAYEREYEQALARIFPDGLQPLPEDTGGAPPTGGVLIDGESERLEAAGLRGGDVIVGLDGWRVDTLDQYDTVVSFRPSPSNVRDMRLRVWRQTQYLDVEPEVRGRRFQVRMRTFGTRGPSYLWR